MKFSGPLIAVKNIEVSRKFYEQILHQTVIFDFGTNVAFDGHLSIQQDFADLAGFDKENLKQGLNNFELYFEEEDFDGFLKQLSLHPEIKYLHQAKQYDWGQRVIRFYDPDMHLIEVGESMETVVKTFLKQGLSIEEIVTRTMHPIEFVKNVQAQLSTK